MSDLFSALAPGTRVVVRYRLPDDERVASGARVTDALGEFLGAQLGADGSRTIQVRTKRGDVAIPAARITHAKAVPPAPRRRAPGPER